MFRANLRAQCIFHSFTFRYFTCRLEYYHIFIKYSFLIRTKPKPKRKEKNEEEEEEKSIS